MPTDAASSESVAGGGGPQRPHLIEDIRLGTSGPHSPRRRWGRFELVLSERLLGELSEVLMRPRFRRYATEEEVEDFLFGLREKGIFFEDVEAERLVPDDPKDDYLVALTRASDADYLVSGDPHLAGAKNKVPVTVLTPRQFSELLESDSP